MELSAQLAHLDGALLGTIDTQFPEPFSEGEKAQIHAYLVLAHAVLEERLEAAFERHFDRVASWLDDGMVPLECVRLVIAVTDSLPQAEKTYKRRDIAGMVRGAGRAELVKRLSQNHGLKAGNVESLAKLVGVDWTSLENSLTVALADLTTLGVKRGAAGHLSPYTEKVTDISSTDGPDDVRAWVEDAKNAVLGLERFLRDTLARHEPRSLIADWDGN